MKILVISDTHHTIGYAYDAIEQEKPDAVFHLGDHRADADDLAAAFDRIPFYSVPGNCDYSFGEADTILTELAGVRIFAAHGHQFGVKSGLFRFLEAAKKAGAQIALFGHTHAPLCDVQSGIYLLNPGACKGYPKATFGVITLENGKIRCEIRELPA